MTPAAELSDDDLTTEILTWSGRVAAGEARLLDLVAEMDARESWFAVGFLTCAHWLSCRLGLGLGTARERVRVARALRGLPLMRAAVAEGRMGYAQVRAATRVATRSDEQTWVEMAPHATGSQLERLARGIARVRRQEHDETDPEMAKARLRTTFDYRDDGTFFLTYRGPAADGAVLLAAIEGACDDLDRQRAATLDGAREATGHPTGASACGSDRASDDGSDGVSAETSSRDDELTPEQVAFRRQLRQRQRTDLGEGLLHLARTGLDALGREHPTSARRSRSRLDVHVDPLSGWARLRDGELLPPTTIKDVARTLPGRHRLRPVVAADLTAHDQGRTARHPSLALRELLGTLDGERCRMPGCTRARRLHAHHVVHWENGGPTDLANLVLVCSRHHTLIHQEGYQLHLRPDRTLTVRTADGTRLLHHPAAPWGDPDELPDVSAGTLRSGESDQRLDLGYAVHVLLAQAA